MDTADVTVGPVEYKIEKTSNALLIQLFQRGFQLTEL